MCSSDLAARPHARITLHMWAWADRNLCAKDFEKAHPDIKVAYSTVDNYVTKLNVLKRAGGSGIPDVYFANSEDVTNLYQLGLTTDLTPYVASSVRAKYAPGTLDPLTFSGKLVAVPHDMAAIGIWYNVKTMKAAGLSVPRS